MFENFLNILSFFLTLIALAFSLITFANLLSEKANEKLENIIISDYDITSYKKASLFYAFNKRAFDIIFSLLTLILLFPILMIISIAIKLYDGGPIFFYQRIIGKDYKIIKKYKFRTFSFSVDSKEVKYTPIGNIIKAKGFHILPTFFNILLGNMTIIGLWNYYGDENCDNEKTKKMFHFSKPGMISATVLAPDIYCLNPDDIIKYDQYYLAHRGFSTDIKLFILCILKAFG